MADQDSQSGHNTDESITETSRPPEHQGRPASINFSDESGQSEDEEIFPHVRIRDNGWVVAWWDHGDDPPEVLTFAPHAVESVMWGHVAEGV